ncbi:membrane protein [Tersicoccus solisilvae]|uniref:Membrane protein n=1 Tax=Tersicoccus solisilvae TaxID=1882339 RepID=A0ABQ1NMN7_9MICC|nr:MgtC/SapB family protein [Tersicoccus solisilvae]GGC78108.1 membrane protein [Tersicoccus solisilvae]
MQGPIGLITGTSLLEVELMLATFVLTSLIGIERQVHQKAAGYRTHVLVGLGSCAFTLVSGWGFTAVLGSDVNLDPSRIAAQIVSGIGFLGAGVIFKGRNVVRGLTTAASIWVAAAVGMACGAGMLSLAALLTLLHLATLFVVAPLVRLLPTEDRRRVLSITYVDGQGVLRGILGLATDLGFASSIQRSARSNAGDRSLISMDIRFIGRAPVPVLVPPLLELAGVERVRVKGTTSEETDEDEDDGDA